MTDLRHLFEQEMRAMAEEGAPFAAEYPEAARMLDQNAVDDRDPYLEQIAPDLAQPLPSVAVVEFALRPEAAEGLSLPAGTRILSEPLADLASPLIFTLTDPVVVDRAKVEAVRVVQGEKGDGYLELELGWDGFDPAPTWPSELDIYLHGDAPVVWALRFALLRRCVTIQA
jgi:type VI protein secretion system component VasA